MIRIKQGDCLAVMAALAAEGARVDSVVTDPPYGIKFMGRGWDDEIAFKPATWAAAYALLPPGGHLVSFGGTRTYHRLVCAIEDAGFEIRDTLSWIYSQGFPKGRNVFNDLIKGTVCQSSANVPVAAQISPSIQALSSEAKDSIAVAVALILPEGVPALLTEIGGAVALHVPMDTWPSEWMANIGLSTTYSWNGSLDDASIEASKSITETKSERTIDSKTWSWLIGLHTSATITQCNVTLPNGSSWPAINAAMNSSGDERSWKNIAIVTALGSVTWNTAARYRGFNVALKPAQELIVLARKPLVGTVAENVHAFGTGALNIDGTRIESGGEHMRGAVAGTQNGVVVIRGKKDFVATDSPFGRWPANVAHDGSQEIMAEFAKYGKRGGSFPATRGAGGTITTTGMLGQTGLTARRLERGSVDRYFKSCEYTEAETASRLRYCAKANKNDRAGSVHPTIKPVSIMRWLITLVTPPGGIVLDPFAGSGTTGQAAHELGFDAILIEQQAEYVADIKRRFGVAL